VRWDHQQPSADSDRRSSHWNSRPANITLPDLLSRHRAQRSLAHPGKCHQHGSNDLNEPKRLFLHITPHFRQL
jgi:hypothetical protein